MAKTESTAVNDLIASVKSGKVSAPAPGDELLFAPPRPPLPQAPAPARMTTTIPPLRGAGEVQPLPRHRTPTGTSQHKLPPSVRVMTAPPARATSIPPLPKVGIQTLAGVVPPAPQGTPAPVITKPAGPTRTALPAVSPKAATHATDDNPFVAKPSRPTIASRDSFTAIERPSSDKSPLERALLEKALLEKATIDKTGDVVAADSWFESSRIMERVDDEALLGTLQTPRAAPRDALLKKLIAPAVGVVLLGVMVGGYVAFNGEGQAHHAQHAKKEKRVAAAGTEPRDVTTTIPPAMGAESSNAATATAGAAPEPPMQQASAEPAVAPVPSAPAAVAAPAPAAAAVQPPEGAAREVATSQGTVKLVDVRIDSHPAGATVMLVDNGKSSFLGTTPVSASVDLDRAYDVVFTLEGRATQMVHFDPTKTHHVDFTLAKAPPHAKPAATQVADTPSPAPVALAPTKPSPAPVASAPTKPAHHAHTPPNTLALADPGFDAPAKPATPKPEASRPATKATGRGTLMVSSKPPCEIYVDGQSTGLTTPQRSIPLAPGAHKITFVNPQQGVNKTVAVSIRSDQPTKLIQNFMAK
jgi:hypothetical protein